MSEIIKTDAAILNSLRKSLLANTKTGVGTKRDTLADTEIGQVRPLTEYELRSLHRGNWFIRRVIEAPAKDMVKAGVEVHGLDDPELTQRVLALYKAGGEQSKYSRKLSGPDAVFRAKMYARWFGRGYIILRVNEGEALEEPLEQVRTFEGFSVLDRYQLRPSIDSVNYDDPEFYQIVRMHHRRGDLGQDVGLSTRIHETRVIPFDGEFLHPYDQHVETADGGHDSVIQQLYECFCSYYGVQNAIRKGLDSYSLFKVAINGLSGIMMSDNGETALQKTLDSIAEMISLHRILVQDGAAANSEFQERSFSGVAENAKSFREEMTAASGLPHYKIWGSVDKSALADSGGAETRAWADTINTDQNLTLEPAHRRIFNALFESVAGEIPEDFTLWYPSIYTPTPEEVATLKKTDAERYQIYIDSGVASAEDVAVAVSTEQDISAVLSAREEEGSTITAATLSQISKLLGDELITAEEARQALATGKDIFSLIPEDGSFPEEELAFEGGALPAEQASGLPSLEDGIAQLDSLDRVRVDKGRKRGKKRNCVQGLPCGNSCIARSKTCRKTPTGGQKVLAQKIRSEAGATSESSEAGETKNSNYKPLMTEAEANEYVADSVFKETFYHGTGEKGADSITSEGVDPSRNSTAVYGLGFYVAGSRDEASTYAADKEGATLLSTKIRATNPREFQNHRDFLKFKESLGLDPLDNSAGTSAQITAKLKGQGFDSVVVRDRNYIVAFDRQQVVTFKRDRVPSDLDDVELDF